MRGRCSAYSLSHSASPGAGQSIERSAAASRDPISLYTFNADDYHRGLTSRYPDLVFIPPSLGRKQPLEVYGPPGSHTLTEHVLAGYRLQTANRCKMRTAWQISLPPPRSFSPFTSASPARSCVTNWYASSAKGS